MKDFNKAIILGNLTRDPESRYTPNGQSVCSFGVATNRRWTDSSGNTQESAEFHNVVAWGKLAEICGQLLYKGRKVLVEGRLQTRSWEGQDGAKRQKTEIVAENFSALGPSRGFAGESTEGAAAGPTEAPEGIPAIENKKSDQEKSSQEKPAQEKSAKKSDQDKKTDDKDKKTEKNDDDEIDLDDIPF